MKGFYAGIELNAPVDNYLDQKAIGIFIMGWCLIGVLWQESFFAFVLFNIGFQMVCEKQEEKESEY